MPEQTTAVGTIQIAEAHVSVFVVQVMQMFDKAESEYRELSEKKRIVENDKDKIRKVRVFTHRGQRTASHWSLWQKQGNPGTP